LAIGLNDVNFSVVLLNSLTDQLPVTRLQLFPSSRRNGRTTEV